MQFALCIFVISIVLVCLLLVCQLFVVNVLLYVVLLCVFMILCGVVAREDCSCLNCFQLLRRPCKNVVLMVVRLCV